MLPSPNCYRWSDRAPTCIWKMSNRARDHLANERTFLAWVRTSVAIVVFGFAIGRFAIALDSWPNFRDKSRRRQDFRFGWA